MRKNPKKQKLGKKKCPTGIQFTMKLNKNNSERTSTEKLGHQEKQKCDKEMLLKQILVRVLYSKE
jgi:hypothetical protein